MLLTEDKLIDWINSKEGLLITRRTLNVNHFNFNRKYDTLYVGITGYSQIIEQFFNIFLKKLINVDKVIVIIIESDVININKEWLNNEKINKIYTWNKPFEHEKIKCIPIGLNYNRQYDIINYWINKNNIKDVQNNKTKLLCMNCSLSTSPERVKLNEIVKNQWGSFCDILPFVPNIRQYFIPSHIEGKIRINVTSPKCYDDWKPYKFILSPQGAGLDCHRTWEAIICGIIPIVKTSSIDELFQDLPVIIVNDWNDINENMLNDKYTEIMNKWNNNEYNMDKINIQYWTNFIKENINNKKTPKIHFITYGNNVFEKAKKRIINEAFLFDEFSSISALGPDDLPKHFRDKFSNILKIPRIAGCGIWRPKIILDKLKTIKDGDFLLYLDAGCTINSHAKKRFNEYLKLFENNDLGIMTVQMTGNKFGSLCKENQYTRKEIFEYFKIDPNSEIGNSAQCLSGILLMQKNKHLMNIMNLWLKAVYDNPMMFTDLNLCKQHDNFIANRHEQSVLSILTKIHNSIVIDGDESWVIPFGQGESLKYPFWATRKRN